MGPKTKNVQGPTTRPRRGRSAAKSEEVANATTAVTKKEENVQQEPSPKSDQTPAKVQEKRRGILRRDLKDSPARRAARRLTQNALRFTRTNASDEDTVSMANRMTMVFKRVPVQFEDRKSFKWDKVPEKKKPEGDRKLFRIRVRESVFDIPCLPDKPPGRCRMPSDDPPKDQAGPSQDPPKPVKRGRQKAAPKKKATGGSKKKEPSPIPEEEKELVENAGLTENDADEAFLCQDTDTDSPLQDVASHVQKRDRLRAAPTLPDRMIDMTPRPGAAAQMYELPTPLFEMDNLMFVDEEPEPSPQNQPRDQPPPRQRRQSFIEAEKRLKTKPRFHIPSVSDDEIPGNRRRRYSVSSRKLQKNSLIEMTASQAKPPIKAGPTVMFNDDDLASVWTRFKDNPDLGYPNAFPGLEILRSFRERTLEAESGKEQMTLPWTDIYRPRSSSNFIGNEATVSGVQKWLTEWKKRLQRQDVLKAKKPTTKKRYRENDDDEDWMEDDVETTLPNLAFIRGGTGIGKTCLVHALAQELGFQVIEVNCSSPRNHKQILSSLEGATRNHRLDLMTMAPPKKIARGPAASAGPSTSDNGIQKYFAPAPKKRSGRKTPPTDPVPLEVITIGDDEPGNGSSAKAVSENNNVGRPMTIILFDDVDVVFEADERFWQSVREIAQNAMVPILMTCKDFDLPWFPIGDVTVQCFELKPINEETPALYYRLLLISRGISLENESNFIRYCQQFNGDLRSCLSNLQFWLDNRRTRKPSKARRRVKTPPFALQPLITAESMDVDMDENFGFDSLKYEVRCIHDQYSEKPVLKWPSRILDGLKDTKWMGSIKEDTLEREQPPDTVQDRFASYFNILIDKPRFANEESPSTSCQENPQQIQAVQEVTAETCPDMAMNMFHRDSFVLDYLPALRNMAAASKQARSNGNRRRGRGAYLYKIGLDDRSGLLQAVLEDNPFQNGQ